ncbi:6-phosphogluconate dehydrogenase [Pseudomassariella vexata]|uniref:6-phosphogluconate dehydrogenase n=1 Tax=Pseudomassariella vexata TaxID=1141098 RepID=A0A1Y2E472_9PEZI|nr:6-phosphogluconate dehydrogenase [Pseudomassariella vexata]ORY66351.1 6-phosphogluconate dehydrogenase [Pseudomassariella vexata]
MSFSAAKVGILSIGDMGMGIARLLVANGFSVATNCQGRSNDTLERARSANIDILNSDVALTDECSVILSVVPPRDAIATAQRVIDALVGTTQRQRSTPLYFADLNAVAPSTARTIASLFEKPRLPVRFVDGCILGGPPSPKPADPAADGAEPEWNKPSIPTSGPHKLSDVSEIGQKLFATLNMKHISPDISAASGLKMCFASTTKGFTSLAIQAFTTAERLGVLDELKHEMQTMIPGHWKIAQGGVIGMAPKAYRWVREMEEIALTFEEEGGFSQDSFQGAAKVFKAVEESELGQEKVGKRKRGTTVDDMAAALSEGMDKRRKKRD